MNKNGKYCLSAGFLFLVSFAVFTALIQIIDVQQIGPMETDVGFANLNGWFHRFTGVNMLLYEVTDQLGIIPVLICLFFGLVGFLQMIKRKSLFKVDTDIIFLGFYYLLVIFLYFIFESVPINYRPILINGFLETSYPSSTALLTASVMPTLIFQSDRKITDLKLIKIIKAFSIFFSSFVIIGRLVSGVHWFTDIIGAILLSIGLFHIYSAAVILYCKKEK